MKLFQFIAFAVILTVNAGAAPIFQDNFDGENGGVGQLNYNALAQWNVNQDSVDLIGNGLYDFYPGRGLFLDLDGTTGSAGNSQIATKVSFGPGNYNLSFFLGNNPGSGSTTNQLKVELGDWSAIYNTSNSIPAANINISFSTAVAGALTFTQFGPSDQQGSILDSVELTEVTKSAETPEPSSWAMLAAGAALVSVRRFRK